MCTGRIDPALVFRSFANGADGVIVVGCRLNECNYTTHGNFSALNKAHLCRRILDHIGIDPARLRIEFMSSGEGILFAETMNDFVAAIKKLGPLGSSEGQAAADLTSRARLVNRLVPYVKLVLKDKLASRPPALEDYERLYSAADIERLFADAVAYRIDAEKCRACMICLRRCPVEAISGGKGQTHKIDQEQCIRCGRCFEVCPPRFAAVAKVPAPEAALLSRRQSSHRPATTT